MKSVNVPIDSTGYPIWDTTGRRDSTILGVCFSPNDSFLYINKYMHTYQHEYNNPDSNQAWYEVHRYDTIAEYSLFGQMQKGIDGRIYIGNFGGLSKQMSVVNNPDVKGVGCNFCPRCLRLDTLGNITAGTPPCMPNYGLGAQVCWALVNDELLMLNEELVVYPNPSSAIFYIKNADGKKKELYSVLGELLFSTKADEMDVRNITKGMYYLRVENQIKKIIVE
jgi:hypothetical protein